MENKFRVASTAETYWAIRTHLLRGTPFQYTRYGDGEIEIMLGRGGGGQSPDPELARETRELFEATDPQNMVGLALHEYEEGMRGLFESWANPEYEPFKLPRRFENAVMPHYVLAFKPGLMKNLMDAVRERTPIHVGSVRRPTLEESLNISTFVPVPVFDSYDEIESTFNQVRRLVDGSTGMRLITLAAGPAKCALVHRLRQHYRGSVQILDLGSVVDMVLGVNSRSWIPKVLAINPNAVEAMMP